MKKVRLTALAVFLLAILCACESWKNEIPNGDYLWVSEEPYIWIDTSEDSLVLLEEYDGASGGSAWASYGNPGEIILEDGTTRRIAVSFSTVRPYVTFFTYENEKWTESLMLGCEFEEGEFTVLFDSIQDRTLVDAFFGGEYNELVFRRKDTNLDSCDLSSGTYYMVGEFEEFMTPYLNLNFDDHTFSFGAGTLVSYAERGSFVDKNEQITASSQSTVFVFEIIDANTLILVDNGDNEFFQMPENSKFVFYQDTNAA